MKSFLHPVFLPAALVLFFDSASFAQTLTVANSKPLKEVPATVNRTKMLQLVNAVRSKGCQCGDTYYYSAPPVVWNAQLETAAYNHTSDMSVNKFFSHYAPDGSRGGDRLQRVGYNWKTYGENIGEGYKTEKEIMDGWLASPGHCKNIMNKTYKEMGVAHVGNYWTQEFGSR